MQAGLTYPGVGFGFGSALSKTASISAQTTVTTSGSNHTKGSWVELESSTDYAVHGFYLIMDAASTSATAQRMLVDVGIGGAGSEVVLVPNILVSSGTATDRINGGHHLYVPMYIPSGTRVAARAQVNTAAAKTLKMAIIFNYSGESLIPTFQKCDALGITTGSTAGVSVTPGSGAYGSYTTIATISRGYSALLVVAAIRDNNTSTNFLGVDVAFNRGSDTFLFRRAFSVSNNESVSWLSTIMPHYSPVIASDVLKARAWYSTSTRSFDVALYGFY